MLNNITSLSKDYAEDLAIAALSYLAGDETRLGRFFSLTGLEPSSLREAAAKPDFHRAILSYISDDETLLLAFCADGGYDPSIIQKALKSLGVNPWERDFA